MPQNSMTPCSNSLSSMRQRMNDKRYLNVNYTFDWPIWWTIQEILVLQKQTSTSEYYELVKELITLSQKEIWERIARLWEDEFAMTVEQKLREQRFKIPSQGAPVTRETIERDFLMNSEIAEALEHLLDLQDDKKESVETRARLVDILYKKLKFAGVKEKETVSSTLAYCRTESF